MALVFYGWSECEKGVWYLKIYFAGGGMGKSKEVEIVHF